MLQQETYGADEAVAQEGLLPEDEGLSETEILKIFEECRSEGDAFARQHRQQAFLNEQFCNGNQFVGSTEKSNEHYVAPIDWFDEHSKKAKPILNNIKLTQSALLVKDRPSVEAVANGGSIDDERQATLTTKYIEYAQQEYETDDKFLKLVDTGICDGTSAIKICVYVDPSSPNPRFKLENLTVHEWIIDPYAQDYDSAEWVIAKKFISKSKGEEIYESNGISGSPSEDTYYDGHNQRRKGVPDYEVWYRPCHKYPRGFYAKIVGSKVVDYVPEYPFVFPSKEGGEESFLPLVFFKCRQVRGSTYGRTWVSDTVSLQTAINEIISRLFRLYKTTTDVHRLVPIGMKDAALANEDSIIYFSDAKEAEGIGFTEPPNISTLHGQLLDFFEDACYDVAGTSPTTTGQQESADQSGIAIEHLAELDAMKNQDAVKSLYLAIEGVFNLLIKCAQKFITVPQMIKIVDDETLKTEIVMFSGADIQGVDIRLQPRSGRETFKAHKEQDALDRMKAGLISPARSESLVGSLSAKVARSEANGLIDKYLTTGQLHDAEITMDAELFLEAIELRQKDALLKGDDSTQAKLELLKNAYIRNMMAKKEPQPSKAPSVKPNNPAAPEVPKPVGSEPPVLM